MSGERKMKVREKNRKAKYLNYMCTQNFAQTFRYEEAVQKVGAAFYQLTSKTMRGTRFKRLFAPV